MKDKLIKFMIVGAVIAFVASSVTVQAIPVNGSISFSDQFTANGTPGNLNTATALTSVSLVTVSQTLGDYGSIVHGTSVSFANVTAGTPFIFTPSTAFAGFWSIVVGGTTYSFDITDTTLVSHTSSTTMVLAGDGIAYISGAINRDPTVGTWNLTLNNNGGLLNFSGGATAQGVPDGGTTVLLLGAALSGLAMIKRCLS